MEKLTETDNWRLVRKLYEADIETEAKRQRGRPGKDEPTTCYYKELLFIFNAAQDTYIPAVGNPCDTALSD